MRAQKSGVIVQLSSGAGLWAGQGAPVYAACKFAVEGLSEALAAEVKPFGIRVHLIEPGIFRTSFLAEVAQGRQVGKQTEGYLDIGGLLKGMHGAQPGDPKIAVQRMFETVTGSGMSEGKEWDVRVSLGSDCYGMLQAKIASLSEKAEKMKDIATSAEFATL